LLPSATVVFSGEFDNSHVEFQFVEFWMESVEPELESDFHLLARGWMESRFHAIAMELEPKLR